MIRILTRGFFLTCTEKTFLFCTHMYIYITQAGMYSYLERLSLVHGGEFPSSQVPCLKSTALVPLAFASPSAAASCQQCIYFYIQITFTSPILLSGTLLSMEFYGSSALLYIWQFSQTLLLMAKVLHDCTFF
jgi:hypothetical protein